MIISRLLRITKTDLLIILIIVIQMTLLVTAYVQDMYKYYHEQEHRAVLGPYMHHKRLH